MSVLLMWRCVFVVGSVMRCDGLMRICVCKLNLVL